MSENNPRLPPSHDNMVNAYGVTMCSALDNVMTTQEQSYDDFMKGFSYITKADMQATLDSVENTQHPDLLSRLSQKAASPQSSSTTFSTCTSKSSCNTQCSTDNLVKNGATESEDLLEEVLEEGTRTSIMSCGQSDRGTHSNLKFDNFVGSEDEGSDGEEDGIGGYVSSFGGTCHNQSKDMNPAQKASQMEESKMLKHTSDTLATENSKDNSDCDAENGSGIPDIFPGEIQDELNAPNIEDMQTNRRLDFVTRFPTEENNIECTKEENNEVCSDEVEPFSLDENFDYDNVILTPKFTADEMELMRSLMSRANINPES